MPSGVDFSSTDDAARRTSLHVASVLHAASPSSALEGRTAASDCLRDIQLSVLSAQCHRCGAKGPRQWQINLIFEAI